MGTHSIFEKRDGAGRFDVFNAERKKNSCTQTFSSGNIWIEEAVRGTGQTVHRFHGRVWVMSGVYSARLSIGLWNGFEFWILDIICGEQLRLFVILHRVCVFVGGWGGGVCLCVVTL